MTQTPSRDWQKDMEMFTAGVEQSRRLGFAATMESSPYQVAIYWLQKSKRLKESFDIAHMAYEGLQGDCVSRGEYAAMLGKLTSMTAARKSEKARADATEAREQQLLALVKEARSCLSIHTSPNNPDVKRITDELSTLYPDTPAPTPKEGSHEA